MRDALRATGRPIVYSINPNSAHANTGASYDWGSVADMWRTTEDITDSWSTGCTGDCPMGITEILDVQAPLYSWAGPQHWNDPDMPEVGVGGTFTPTENRAHLSMWSMMAAPLIAGNDITSMPTDVRTVLTNPDLLAIDQDSAGRQAQRVSDFGETEVWAKTLSDGSAAVALLNRSAATATVSTTATAAGLPAASGYNTYEVWTQAIANTTGAISATVPPHGVVMYRVRTGSATPTDSFSLRGAGSVAAWTCSAAPRTTAPKRSSGTATAASPRSSPRSPASCASVASAWTPRATAPPTAPG
jgi:alpha-galactosidase